MARLALEQDLTKQVGLLAGYDAVVKEVECRYDLVGSPLSTLVPSCQQNGGMLSKNRRKQFALSIPADAFDFIEASVRMYFPHQETPTDK
jgi:hypothetical protein